VGDLCVAEQVGERRGEVVGLVPGGGDGEDGGLAGERGGDERAGRGRALQLEVGRAGGVADGGEGRVG
jgi:hypothetical protein